MIHFGVVLAPAIILAIGGIIALVWSDEWGRSLGLLAAALGVGGIIYVIDANYKSSGHYVVVQECVYPLQELVIPNGTKIQVVTEDDGSILNITKITGRVFPGGRIAWRLKRKEPSMGLYWESEEDRPHEWVSSEIKERTQ